MPERERHESISIFVKFIAVRGEMIAVAIGIYMLLILLAPNSIERRKVTRLFFNSTALRPFLLLKAIL